MLVKWLGALLILAAAAAWGNLQAAQLRRRVKELEEFRLGMRLLAAEIGYTSTPLPRALEHVQERLPGGGVSVFFTRAGELLRNPEVADANAAWSRAADEVKEELALTREDWPVLLRAGAGLGSMGRENQIKQLEAAEVQLASHAATAAARCESGEKMWRYLGVMGGLAVVILLL
ncbi:hypothetical protein [Dethiobacter alkaliphilus]|uniref:hypothetical protein n=1 Tax=Dethiobacter alkaliphilus TaxID=427926 RepID=UPI002226DB1D|nr:hypothetical protein [Dethiobacter alkaliphilus]MCW3490280.1 hypothetical protein [Dethiobacter alkaliphilus]